MRSGFGAGFAIIDAYDATQETWMVEDDAGFDARMHARGRRRVRGDERGDHRHDQRSYRRAASGGRLRCFKIFVR